MYSGQATTEGSRAYAKQFQNTTHQDFYREANGWYVSSVGLGACRGVDEEEVLRYRGAVKEAFHGGVNLFDCGSNRFHANSERRLGEALQALIHEDNAHREAFIVCGHVDCTASGACGQSSEIRQDKANGGCFIELEVLLDEVERSRDTLGFESLDICYLSGIEAHLDAMDHDALLCSLHRVFEALELCIERGRLTAYGVATWNGFRRRDPANTGLQLSELLAVAREVAGSRHHFRFVQVPFNLMMVEAFTIATQRVNGEVPRSILDVAHEMGICVITTSTLLQSRLTRDLPPRVTEIFPEAETDAQRAIQFARSAPSVVSALAGMSRKEHVIENLGVARFAPVEGPRFRRLF